MEKNKVDGDEEVLSY